MQHEWDQRLGVWWIAEDHPDRPAIAASPTGEALTYGELAGRAHQLARALGAFDLDPGAIVAYAFPNGVDAIVWQLACQESGLRYLSLNPALSTDEFRGILEHSEARVLAVHPTYADRFADAEVQALVPHRIAVRGSIPGFRDVADVLAPHPQTRPETVSTGGAVSYSSGTTGKPKGIWKPLPTTAPDVALNAQAIFGRAFQFLPFKGPHLVSAGMFHGGCQGFYLGALNVGQALVIMERFDAEATLALIEEYRVTTAYMVPTQFVRLLRLPSDVRERYDVSSLTNVVHSAAPCPREIKQQMFDWFGPVIWETYGGMEGAATIAKPHHWLANPGTVGRAVTGVRLSILDDDGNELPAGQIGHVFQESAASFKYRGDQSLTDEVHRGRAFTIGDLGYLTEDGFLFICDRAKDMLISGGVNIYPAEIEGVLSAHPAVGDVAVLGVPDPEWGERVHAVVELVDAGQAGETMIEELTGYCREHLAGYKCPRSMEFRTDLPRTDTGKLLKRNLRDEFWAAAGRSV